MVVGGGPAGMAPLVWAARQGLLSSLARDGLVVVERGSALGAGTIGSYAIGSDTLSETFLECLEDSREPRLTALLSHPSVEILRAYRGGSAPLPMVAAFLTALGAAMQAEIEAAGGTVLLGHEALSANQRHDKTWLIRVCSQIGGEQVIVGHNVLLEAGGVQDRGALFTTLVA